MRRAFTTVEVLVALFLVAGTAAVGLGLFAGIHFILKHW